MGLISHASPPSNLKDVFCLALFNIVKFEGKAANIILYSNVYMYNSDNFQISSKLFTQFIQEQNPNF